MTDERHEQLIDDYLHGRADEATIRMVDRLVRADESFRATLLTAAVTAAALQDRSGSGPATVASPPRSRGWLAGMASAAVAAAAAAGWLWLATPERSDACQVVDTRGSVLLLGATPGDKPEPLAAGDVITSDRRIWTCPWGAVALQLADGTRVQFDRGSEAKLVCTRRPRIDLAQGTAFVTRKADAAGEAIVTSPHAAITIDRGLAAVIADGERTIVEVAEGEARLTDLDGRRQTRVVAGQVAVVERDSQGDIRVREGRLSWELPDDSAAAAPGSPIGCVDSTFTTPPSGTRSGQCHAFKG
jgi:ferric-dicitrate binding protein FerR (iron transport regulator)